MPCQQQPDESGKRLPDEPSPATDRLLVAVGVGSLTLAVLLLVISGWAIVTAIKS